MWISFLNLIVLSTFNMANFQCKKLDPFVTGDIGSFCVECLQDTNFRDAEGNQTFRFVNRIPADRDVYNEEGDKS